MGLAHIGACGRLVVNPLHGDKGNPVKTHDPPSVIGLLYEMADSLEIIVPMFSSPYCGRLGRPALSPPHPRRHLAKPPPL